MRKPSWSFIRNNILNNINFMQKIALPGKVEFIETSNPNHRQIIIEPCYPGYGTTIGNALRRVLLSSLPGAAAIGVKIKGADHEFMTLPHVKEDVLELVLNIKKLRLKIFSDEAVKLELDARGEKQVKAGDIKKNSLVEIANPDLVLGNITDMAGKLEMEIFVAKGLGYITVESRESDKHEIGYIEMDSIFSPILSVGVSVENVRVGKMTNWDKLVVNLVTDGTIAPAAALGISIGYIGCSLIKKRPTQKNLIKAPLIKGLPEGLGIYIYGKIFKSP
ncbi:MAG: DNA-directed RNA polymerase subunit alpha [Parcubacteria group bacterium GW2011_GWA2_44_15]|nr:MAG: DNA-directed RNA polymerase subunit alpha [Parcubacteria group bacterium GW2011_GWA2_44_15]